MRNIVLYLLLVIIIGCSNKEKTNQTLENSVPLEEQSIVIQDNQSNFIETIDFGSVKQGSTITKNIIISNKTRSTIPLDLSGVTAQIESTQRFRVISNNCTLLKINQICKLIVKFQYVENESDSLVETQIFRSDRTEAFGSLIFLGVKQISNPEQSSIQVKQIGTMINANSKIRYYLQNTGVKIANVLNNIPGEFLILNNNCKAVMKPKETCWIDLKIDPSKIISVGAFQKTITINNENKVIQIGVIPQGSQDVALCNSSTIRINNVCVPLSNYYNEQCGCFKDIPYVDQQTSFTMDGPMNTGVGFQKMDLYKSANPNGKIVVYTHPMGGNKDLDIEYETLLKNEAINRGYSFVSIEFRHPILESDEVNSTVNQWDIINSLKFVRLNMQAFNLWNVDDIYSFSYSKGSLLLANITMNSPEMIDVFGRIGLKKMFILDGQVTYNFNSYYQNFIDKNPIQLNMFISMSALSYFTNLNNLAKASLGFKLTSDLSVIDALRNVSSETQIIPSNKLPDIFFAYNHANKNRLLRSNEVLSPSGVLNMTESDYLLHNPQSGALFCSHYNIIKSCNIVDGLNYFFNVNDVFNFFGL